MHDTHISAPDLYALIKENKIDGVIVDVRTPEEFGRGHLEGARNIPLDTVTDHAEELKKFAHVYLYCFSGSRSTEAQTILETQGVTNTINLTSGIMAWRMHQLPMV